MSLRITLISAVFHNKNSYKRINTFLKIMEYWTILVSALLILILTYYVFKPANYFAIHKIPQSPAVLFLGDLWKFIFNRKSIVDFIISLYSIDSTAKYVGFYEMGNPVILIRDLDLIKSITVKHFDHFIDHRGFTDPDIEPLFGGNLFSLRGDRWREIRNLLSPAFTSSKMKGMFKLMSNCAATFVNSLNHEVASGMTEIDTKDIFTRYTNDAIATCAFGIAVDSMKDPNNEFYVLGRRGTNFGAIIGVFKFLAVRSYPKFAKLFGIKIIDQEVENFFYKLVRETIETRDKNNISRPDVIQLMMEKRGSKIGTKTLELSIEDMTAQAFVFFFGGFESTSTLMCFVAHEIAANSEVQDRVQQEIDDMMEKCGGDITYEAINGMEYLEAVINEALRMYPTVALTDRVCTKSFELPPTLPGHESVVLQPGANISLPIFAIHRDPQYFDDPNTFKPERFLGKNHEQLNTAAYFPFGMGPRMCIGNRFALLETKVLLVHLLAKFRIRVGKKMMMPMRFSKSLAMTAEGGFWLELTSKAEK